MENLKKRETIGWYRDIRLYDDELDDNGAVSLGVKIRVMPSCFFILVRYYLRVDKGKLQIHSVYLLFIYYTNYIDHNNLLKLISNCKSARLQNLSCMWDKQYHSRIFRERI